MICTSYPTKTQLSNFLGTPGEDYFKGNPKSLKFYFLVIWWGKTYFKSNEQTLQLVPWDTQWLFKSSLSPRHRWFGRRSVPQCLSQRISFWNSTPPTGRSIEHTWLCPVCMAKSFYWRLSNIKKSSGAGLGCRGCSKCHHSQGVDALDGWNMLWHVVLSCQLQRCWIPFGLGRLTWELAAGCHILKARLLGWTRPTTTFCQSLGWRTCKLQRGEVIETCRNSKHPSSFGGRAPFGLSQLDR